MFFTDLWQLNGDRPRGAPSKEYKERERARDLLVASYVASYDVSINPTVVEGESMQSVKNNRSALVEQWWYSGRVQEIRILPVWYQELKDRCLEVIKLPGFGGSMVTCFAVQLYGEKMNLSDVEVMHG